MLDVSSKSLCSVGGGGCKYFISGKEHNRKLKFSLHYNVDILYLENGNAYRSFLQNKTTINITFYVFPQKTFSVWLLFPFPHFTFLCDMRSQ